MIVVDGRNKAIDDVLLWVRDALCRLESLEERIDVLVDTREDAKKVNAFCAMSGCTTSSKQNDGHFVLSILDRTCRCGG